MSLLKIQYQSTGGTNTGAGGDLIWDIGSKSILVIIAKCYNNCWGDICSSNRWNYYFWICNCIRATCITAYGCTECDNDGLAYGSITVNHVGEGSSATSPTALGGLKRTPDGYDTDENSTDFTTVDSGLFTQKYFPLLRLIQLLAPIHIVRVAVAHL